MVVDRRIEGQGWSERQCGAGVNGWASERGRARQEELRMEGPGGGGSEG